MDLVQQIAELKAALDEANKRIAALESAPAASGAVSDDVTRHMRMADYIFGTFFGNEVIKFNEQDAAEAAKANVAG